MRKSLLSAILLITGFGVLTPQSDASVYINSDNVDLRNSLNVLVNAGYINTPLQQWPTPWRALLLELESINKEQLNQTQLLAFRQVRHYLHNAEHGPQTYLKVEVHSEDPWINRFGRSIQERGNLSIARHFKGERFAAKIQINHRWETFEGSNKETFDGSYLAYNFGDLSVSLDALPLWWGPAQHSSLLMSSNARPVNKLRLDYSPDFAPVGINQLHISAFIGQNKTEVARSKVSRELLGFRAATKLYWAVTGGVSVIHQDSAEVTSANDFTIPANTMVSFDLRKGWSWGEQHFAAYTEVAFDGQLQDGEHPAFTMGGEWQFNHSIFSTQEMRHTLIAEYTDSESMSFYQRINGMPSELIYQHYERNLGSSFAPDSKTLSLSYRLYAIDGSGWTAQFSHSKLTDGRSHTQALLERSQPLLAGLLNIGFEYNDRELVEQDELGAHLSWEWRF